jgi:radical SAM protein with 4Fe4S-binding SPASM domain
MIAVAEEAGADSLTFHNLIFTSRKLLEEQRPYDAELGSSSKDWEGFDFEPGVDPQALYAKMSGILAGRHSFNVDLYPNFSRSGLIRYYRDPCFAPTEYSASCMSPWIAAYVFPDGEVRPCLNSTYSFGNIKEKPFGRIWNSDRAVRFRRTLKKNGIFPLCRRCTELYRY